MQLLLPLHLLEKPVCLLSLSQVPLPDHGLRRPLGAALPAPTLPSSFTNCPLEAVTPLGWGGWGGGGGGAFLHLSEAQGLCGISMLTQRGSPG